MARAHVLRHSCNRCQTTQDMVETEQMPPCWRTFTVTASKAADVKVIDLCDKCTDVLLDCIYGTNGSHRNKIG